MKELVLRFWGDLEQLMFGKRYIVTDAPALVAIYNNEILGFIFYTIFDEEAALIVALGVRPEYQGRGVGQALVKAVEEYARQEQKRQLLVVTSNDNIPALTFYQCQGFQLFEVVPDVIEEKLGGRVLGVNKIPIRDELRFRKALD
ncbi:MAG: GNAT family N-acetyltransferase [Promethearchaeota archaeon]